MKFESVSIRSNQLKWILSAYFVVNILHAVTHAYFKVIPSIGHSIFALIVFMFIPTYYLALVLRNKFKYEHLIGLFAMSLVGGTYAFLYHFVIQSPDFVCFMGCKVNGWTFVYSAYAITAILFLLTIVTCGQLLKIIHNEQPH